MRAHHTLLRAPSIDPGQVHFLDEAGIRIGETRRTGLSAPGQRVVEAVVEKHWQTETMIGTLSLSGISTMMTIAGAMDSDVYLTYVETQLAPILHPGDIVVMDNLRVHACAAAIEAIEARGAYVLFIPPYSPDLNPIEHAWSKLKAIVRGARVRTRIELESAIAAAIHAITASDAAAWFAHCGYGTVPFPPLALS